MRRPAGMFVTAAVAGAVLVAAVVIFARAGSGERASVPAQPAGPTVDPAVFLDHLPQGEPWPTPTAVQPIYTAEDALARSLAELPSGTEPSKTVVRLVSRLTFGEQFAGSSGDHCSGPVWAVGVVAPGLTIPTGSGIAYPEPFPPVPTATPIAVLGFYFGWDANAGYLSSQGTLEETGPYGSIEALEALVDESLPIAPATEMPSFDALAEPDAASIRRAEAQEFANGKPDEGDPEVVLATIKEYLHDEDPAIRAAGVWALTWISHSSEAGASGLRQAVKADEALVDALHGAMTHERDVDCGDLETPGAIASLVYELWRDDPTPRVEAILTDGYEHVLASMVRYHIVIALCGLKLSSAATERVLLDAKEAHDPELARLASGCHAQLFP